MTLQPMTTAPRDGSEVLLLRSGTGRKQFELRKWCGEHKLWEWSMGEDPCDCFSGWLDVKSMARDSERLDWLEKDAESCVERGEFPNTRRVTRFALVHAAFLVPNRPTVRAAIDKEMSRCK